MNFFYTIADQQALWWYVVHIYTASALSFLQKLWGRKQNK